MGSLHNVQHLKQLLHVFFRIRWYNYNKLNCSNINLQMISSYNRILDVFIEGLRTYPFNFSILLSSFLTYSCSSNMIASSVDNSFWRSIFDVKYPSFVSKIFGAEPTSSTIDEEDEGYCIKLSRHTIPEYIAIFIFDIWLSLFCRIWVFRFFLSCLKTSARLTSLIYLTMVLDYVTYIGSTLKELLKLKVVYPITANYDCCSKLILLNYYDT